jgi:hypothetical protein
LDLYGFLLSTNHEIKYHNEYLTNKTDHNSYHENQAGFATGSPNTPHNTCASDQIKASGSSPYPEDKLIDRLSLFTIHDVNNSKRLHIYDQLEWIKMTNPDDRVIYGLGVLV